MAFDNLHEEIAGEFGSFGGYREFFEGVTRETRTSKRKKAEESWRIRYSVRVAYRELAAKKAETWKCGGCGTELRDNPHQRGPRKRWCSKRCYFRIYARNLREPMKQPQPAVICACGKETQRSPKGGPPKKWCSRNCEQRAYRARKRAGGAA